MTTDSGVGHIIRIDILPDDVLLGIFDFLCGYGSGDRRMTIAGSCVSMMEQEGNGRRDYLVV